MVRASPCHGEGCRFEPGWFRMVQVVVRGWQYARSDSSTAKTNAKQIIHRVDSVFERHFSWRSNPAVTVHAACGTQFDPIMEGPEVWDAAADLHVPRKRHDVKCSKCRTTKKTSRVVIEVQCTEVEAPIVGKLF